MNVPQAVRPRPTTSTPRMPWLSVVYFSITPGRPFPGATSSPTTLSAGRGWVELGQLQGAHTRFRTEASRPIQGLGSNTTGRPIPRVAAKGGFAGFLVRERWTSL